MHRKKLLDQLKHYANSNWCTSKHQLRNLNFITKFIEKNPDCFNRELLEGHLTASAWLLNTTKDHFLLTHHKKLGIWIQLGGHADGHTDMLEVAVQEAKEESGIDNVVPLSKEIFDIDIHEIPAYQGIPAHLHYDIRYLLQTANTNQFKVSAESFDLKWFNVDNVVMSKLNTSVQGLLKKWRNWNYSYEQ